MNESSLGPTHETGKRNRKKSVNMHSLSVCLPAYGLSLDIIIKLYLLYDGIGYSIYFTNKIQFIPSPRVCKLKNLN
jgi:hypothetical protein